MGAPPPNWIRVLLGRHVFGHSLSEETEIARECFVVGLLLGLLVGLLVALVLADGSAVSP